MIFNQSGGAILNFKIVGGTTVPSNPSENTIWINTSTPIADWYLQNTEPTAIEGRVWIVIGTSSVTPFNALKKNGLYVYPLTAKQYVSGAWVSKPISIYRGGVWDNVLSELYLYKAGDEYVSITGGWEEGSVKNGSLTKNTTNLTLFSDANSAYAIAITNKKISISGAKTVTINAITANTNSYSPRHYYGLSTSNLITSNDEAVAYKEVTEAGQVTLDISNVAAGEYYIYLMTRGISSRLAVDAVRIDMDAAQRQYEQDLADRAELEAAYNYLLNGGAS